MSNIVFLSTLYLGSPSANGICARNLVEALEREGHSVDVIGYWHNEITVENYHPIEKKSDRSMSIFRKIRKAFGLLCHRSDAVLDMALVNAYYLELCRLQKQKNIDTIVAMFFPPESLEALRQFKKAYGNIKAICYELDSVGDGVSSSQIQILANKTYDRWLNKVYSTIDTVVIMKSHEDYWKTKFGKKYADLMAVSDLPVLIPNESISTNDDVGLVSLVYSGAIEKRYRSPFYLLAVLKQWGLDDEFDFSFFSKGDCEEEIRVATQECPNIKQYGYIPQEQLQERLASADFLVSIGNAFSHSVPSKVITYIASGKPIIHFSSQKDDVCNEYLSKYPLSLVIDQSMPVEQSCERLKEFVKETRGKKVDFSLAKQLFPMNDPQYSANLIAKEMVNFDNKEVL